LPAAEKAVIKNCIGVVVHGSFTTQAAEQLLGYIVELMCWRPPQDSEASQRWHNYWLQWGQREKKVREKEIMVTLDEKWCHMKEEDLERDESAHKAEIRQILAKIKKQNRMCDKRWGVLARRENRGR
jgi:hypothetical protein